MGWYRAALWSEKPVCYIGTYPIGNSRGYRRSRDNYISPYAEANWNYSQGQSVRVVCYTNAPQAHLTLNGQPIGGEPQRDENTDILFWDINYTAGTLRCEATNGAFYEIKTTKAPCSLRLTTDSVAHVFVEIIDEDGMVVKQADNEVTLYVQGARLLGLENGNIMDNNIAGRQQRNRQRAFNGHLVGYFEQSKEKGETITIRATSPFLQPAEIKF
jgi:hypothetical protein